MIQTAEGSMNEISNILIRLRELSIQAASDTIGDTERGFTDKEVQQLKQEIDRISNSTVFNGMHLLNGTEPALEIQVGIGNDPASTVSSSTSKSSRLRCRLSVLNDISTKTKEQSQQNLQCSRRRD